MNKTMTKNAKIYAVIAVVAVLGAIGGVYYLSTSKTPLSDNLDQSRGIVSEAQMEQAKQSLKKIISLADQYSGVQPSSFNVLANDKFGRSGNFGIYLSSNGERLAEENIIQFHQPEDQKLINENAEYDSVTGMIISMHRNPQFAGTKMSQGVAGQKAIEFLKEVTPDFETLNSINQQYQIEEKEGKGGKNYFYRWSDNTYQSLFKPGVEFDNTPYIQVGYTDTGYIFSYENTYSAYRAALNQEKVKQYLK